MSAASQLNILDLGKKAMERGHIPIAVRGKAPIAPGWQNTTMETAEKYLQRYGKRATGIGIVCGNVFVLDVDVKDNGIGAWADLLVKYRVEEPLTPKVSTPSGGFHLYFTPTELSGRIRNSVRLSGSGIDVRTTGGQVVYPGSISATEGQPNYTWSSNRTPEDVTTKPLPRWLALVLLEAQGEITAEERSELI